MPDRFAKASLRVLAGLLLVALSRPALAAQTGSPVASTPPAQTLLRAADAARTANYRGTVIYRSGDSIDSLRLVHGFSNGLERERLVALTGEPREIIRIDNKITCLLPKERKLDLKRPVLKGLLTNVTAESLQQLSAWYALKDIGAARIAGRACRGVALAPRDGYRFGYELWADEATGVPLRVALVGPAGEAHEEVMFTEVEFPASLPDQAFLPELDPRKFRVVARTEPTPVELPDGAERALDFPLRIESLPPGYRVTMRDRRPANDNHGPVEHVLLSDGLSAISVFAADNVPPDRAFEGLSQLGAVQAYGRMVGHWHVTVVGETPAAAVQAVGDGLKPQEALRKP